MDRRYQIFAKTKVRNIAGFNAKISKDKAEQERAKAMEAEMTAEERAAATQIEVPRMTMPLKCLRRSCLISYVLLMNWPI